LHRIGQALLPRIRGWDTGKTRGAAGPPALAVAVTDFNPTTIDSFWRLSPTPRDLAADWGILAYPMGYKNILGS
jgi:hypothetical protein